MILILDLQIFLIICILLCSIFLIISKNPIFSILFLILVFCGCTGILILFGVDFIGLLFIVIYVGAIAVLFLFVVMMLDLKINYYSFNEIVYLTVIIFFFVPVLFGLLYSSDLLIIFDKPFHYFPTFFNLMDFFFNIDVFGQSLYNYFLVCFLLAGMILLVAMLGAIILTLKYSSRRKSELFLRQLSRNDKFLSFFY